MHLVKAEQKASNRHQQEVDSLGSASEKCKVEDYRGGEKLDGTISSSIDTTLRCSYCTVDLNILSSSELLQHDKKDEGKKVSEEAATSAANAQSGALISIETDVKSRKIIQCPCKQYSFCKYYDCYRNHYAHNCNDCRRAVKSNKPANCKSCGVPRGEGVELLLCSVCISVEYCGSKCQKTDL